MPKAQPKISIPEAVLIGMFLGILDAIDLIPIAGDLTDVAAAPLVLYYYMKHINGVMFIVSEVLDAIPVVQEFPSRSVVWWGTVAFDHLAPKQLEEKVEKMGEEAEGGEEGAPTGEGEGALEEEAENAGKEGESLSEGGDAQGGGGEVEAEVEAGERQEVGSLEEEGGGGEEMGEGGEEREERGEERELEEGFREPGGEGTTESEEGGRAGGQQTADEMAGEEEIPWDQREEQEQFEGGMDDLSTPKNADDEGDEEEDADEGGAPPTKAAPSGTADDAAQAGGAIKEGLGEAADVVGEIGEIAA